MALSLIEDLFLKSVQITSDAEVFELSNRLFGRPTTAGDHDENQNFADEIKEGLIRCSYAKIVENALAESMITDILNPLSKGGGVNCVIRSNGLRPWGPDGDEKNN